MNESGECGRLEPDEEVGSISAAGTARGVIEGSTLTVFIRDRWGFGVCESGAESGTKPSFEEFRVDCREFVAEVVGVGDLGTLPRVLSVVTTFICEGSCGDGNFWMTPRRSLFVRIAADWIMDTWCARFGRIAGTRRGVKGIMTSCAKVRNSANHLRAVDC